MSEALPILQTLNLGGSGTGMSYYTAAMQCARKANLDKEASKKFVRGPKSDKVDARLVGTVFHALAEYYHGMKIRAEIDKPAIAVQLDDIGVDVEITEAERVFLDYTDNFKTTAWGEVLGTEVLLEGPAVEAAMGISPMTGRIDLVTEMSEGDINYWAQKGFLLEGPGVYIIDHKTIDRRDSDAYLKYLLRLQFKAYAMMWTALHPDKPCRGAIANTVIRTQKIKYEQYFAPAPDLEEQERLRKWLKEAKARADANGVNIAHCGEGFKPCWHYRSGKCTRD